MTTTSKPPSRKRVRVKSPEPSKVARRHGWARARMGVFNLSAIILGFYALFPVIWILITSLKPQAQLTTQPVTLIPTSVTLGSYRTALSQAPFGRYYFNSLLVTVSSTIFSLILGTFAGYALARLRFRFKRLILMIILAFSFLPPITLVVPLFNLFRHFNLLNTYWALIIPYTFLTLPICVWLMNAYLQDLPKELEEAAMVDGLTTFGAFFRIILRVSVPGVVTTGLIIFATNWNEFLLALTFMTNNQMRTLPVGIALYPGQYTFPWGIISAATVLALVPVALGVSVFQRRLISGLTLGAVK
ncbi:MAG: carbohydrate ABC transporter permease [Acidimicrobiaceae bacterium]|nr:carbohydrate ABC transporter permease [Acidimicrobiaceae bacterium]